MLSHDLDIYIRSWLWRMTCPIRHPLHHLLLVRTRRAPLPLRMKECLMLHECLIQPWGSPQMHRQRRMSMSPIQVWMSAHLLTRVHLWIMLPKRHCGMTMTPTRNGQPRSSAAPSATTLISYLKTIYSQACACARQMHMLKYCPPQTHPSPPQTHPRPRKDGAPRSILKLVLVQSRCTCLSIAHFRFREDWDSWSCKSQDQRSQTGRS